MSYTSKILAPFSFALLLGVFVKPVEAFVPVTSPAERQPTEFTLVPVAKVAQNTSAFQSAARILESGECYFVAKPHEERDLTPSFEQGLTPNMVNSDGEVVFRRKDVLSLKSDEWTTRVKFEVLDRPSEDGGNDRKITITTEPVGITWIGDVRKSHFVLSHHLVDVETGHNVGSKDHNREYTQSISCR